MHLQGLRVEHGSSQAGSETKDEMHEFYSSGAVCQVDVAF